MRTITHKVVVTPSTKFTLYHLTDLHLGSASCDEQRLKEDIERIRSDPTARWLGGGDYIDGITHRGDKRFQMGALAKWCRVSDIIGTQVDRAAELLAPIADRCDGMISGNHEASATRHYDRDAYWELVRRVAEASGREPEDLALGVNGFVAYQFRTQSERSTVSGNGWPLTVFLHHGAGGGRLPGGHALALGRILGDYECNLALIGHRHTRMYLPKVITRPHGKTREAAAMFTASYLRQHIQYGDGRDKVMDGYAEQMMLPDLPIGTTPIHIYPSQRRFVIELPHGC